MSIWPEITAFCFTIYKLRYCPLKLSVNKWLYFISVTVILKEKTKKNDSENERLTVFTPLAYRSKHTHL
jgi:hypothetical protein